MKQDQSNPTPALPLSGEGVSTQKSDTAGSSSSPCEGGGWEGVSSQRLGVSEKSQAMAHSTPSPEKGEAGRGSKTRLHNLKSQKNKRRQLRKNQTEPEKRFWSWVRNKQLGTKFRRQQGIGKYIIDFYCAEFGLIIEIDGDSHYTEDAEQYDNERTTFLESKGFQVIRFTNLDVMQNKEGVLQAVVTSLKLLKDASQ